MPVSKGKQVASTEVPDAIAERIRKRAKQEERTRSGVIYRAIVFYLEHAPLVKKSADVPSPQEVK